jgi:hypothetical protein
MGKHYLYLLLALFLFINAVEYIEEGIKKSIKKESLLRYKLNKQNLYASNIKEVKSILRNQEKTFVKNKKLFFKKKKKETIVFSEIQEYIQVTASRVEARITQLNSGVVIQTKHYKQYPMNLVLTLIPEDLDNFFRQLYESKKYFFIDSIQISTNPREQMLHLKIKLIGYQLQ